MLYLDENALNLRRLWILAAATVFMAACSPSSNRASSPRLRGAAAAKPCPNSAKNTTTQPANDGSALALSPVSDESKIVPKAGGFILTENFGIEAGLNSQKSRVTFSDGSKELLGNPKGLAEVLNIPACTDPRPKIDQRTLKRCVSRAVWEDLNLPTEQATLSKILNAPWAPRKFFKQCTAAVTVDGHDFGDLLSSGRRSGVQRIRVWTAEHCYQSSYAASAQLFLSAGDVVEVQAGVRRYISIPLHKVDGLEFSKAIVSKNGNGQSNDPNLSRKMFILRSMDGRSAESYKSSVLEGCLLKKRQLDATSPFKQLRYVDCFTTADVATFKAGIDLSNLSENPFNESFDGKSLAEVRRAVLKDVLAKEKNRFDTLQKGSNPDLDGAFQIAGGVIDVFGFAEFVVSQMDGIGHSRRVEAMDYEQAEFSISSLDDLGSFSENFRTYQYDATSAAYFELFFKLTNSFGPAGGQIGCIVAGALNSVGGILPSCPPYVLSPQHAVELEARYYQPVKDLKTFTKLLLGKFLVTAINPEMSDAHPLKIKPTDDNFVVTTKFGAILTRLLFESALLRDEPFAEVRGYNVLGKAFQQILRETCPSSVFANQTFPVLINRKNSAGQLTFGQAGVLGLGQLRIMPIVGTDVGKIPGFDTSAACTKAAVVGGLGGLGGLVARGGNSLPTESVIAIDVDDKLLCLPVDGNENPECSVEGRRNAATNYMGRRVIYKFEGAQPNPANIVGPTDSGTLWTFLLLPAFALTSHNGELVNGVVFDQIPDINTIDPDQAAPATDAQGNPIGTCN